MLVGRFGEPGEIDGVLESAAGELEVAGCGSYLTGGPGGRGPPTWPS